MDTVCQRITSNLNFVKPDSVMKVKPGKIRRLQRKYSKKQNQQFDVFKIKLSIAKVKFDRTVKNTSIYIIVIYH